jgi:hypothetical protein
MDRTIEENKAWKDKRKRTRRASKKKEDKSHVGGHGHHFCQLLDATE